MSEVADLPAAAAYAQRFATEGAARKYATRFAHGTRRAIHEREVRALRKILTGVSVAGCALDMPCGTGRFLPVLAERFQAVIATDVSPEMLKLAAERDAGSKANLVFARADAAATGFPDGHVDFVFCNRLLHHLPNSHERVRVLREIHRLTLRYAVVSFFDYGRFLRLRLAIKRLQGRRCDYKGHQNRNAFVREIHAAGFAVRRIVGVGAFWRAQKLLLIEKAGGVTESERQ